MICAQCCGEKRVLEIDCPEDCQFLIAGREREAEEFGKRVANLDPRARERNKRVLLEHQHAVAYLEYAISRERILSRELTDRDVVHSIDVLLETYRTEQNGILYEKTLEDLRVESLRRELRSIMESLRNPERKESSGIVDTKSERLTLSAAMDCLEYIRSVASSFMVDRHASTGYVDFLARITPRKEARGSILLP